MTRAGESGFTLLELLVVIAILALGASLVGPRLRPAGGGVALRAAGAAVVEQLGLAREAAIRDGRPRCLAAPGAASDGCDALRVEPGVAAETSAPVRFFGDGSSSGARIALRSGTARRDVSVVGATGQITLR